MGDTATMNAFAISQDRQGQKERLADKQNAPGSVSGQPTGAGTANNVFAPFGIPIGMKTPATAATQNQGIRVQSNIQSQRQRALNGASVGGAPPAGNPGKTSLGS